MTLREFDRLDPDERAYWVADWELGRQECSQHGGPASECSDAGKPWFPQMSVCYAAMETASARKRWELKYPKEWHNGDFTSWSDEPDAGHPIHRDAGVNIWAAQSDLGIGGDFLTASPHQGAREQGEPDDQPGPHDKGG